MLKIVVTFLIFLSVSTLWVSSAYAFGPEEWTQYRMNETNNPFFNDANGEPLDMTSFLTDNEVRATPVVVGNGYLSEIMNLASCWPLI
ncbi:hypothetical protein [Sinobaca sp. H24]|uniref:hypothetical protein n=1 Tax=Sinobaca sp. H24 TaxID=2923376 RepID=UPI00207A270B|nr:hypothetical protein [Sinobaca sp. H24]